MNFPLGRQGLAIPNFENDVTAWNVLKGIIAAEGKVYIDEEKSAMRITDASREYISSIAALARKFNFEFNEREVGNEFMLEFGKSQIKEMLRTGVFVNPYHEDTTLQFAREILEGPKDYQGLTRAEFLLFVHLYKTGVKASDIESYFRLGEEGSQWYAAKAYRLGLIKVKRRSGTLPKSKIVRLDVALKTYMPPDETMPRLVAFMHNCNVSHKDIKTYLGIDSVGQELNKSRKLGLRVLDKVYGHRYMQRDAAQVAEIYRKSA